MLATALEHEPVTPAMRQAASAGPMPAGKVIRFPQFYYIVSGLAAACFAVFFAYTEYNRSPAYPSKHYVEVPLQPSVAAAPASEPESVALPAVEGDIPVTDKLALKDISSADEKRREIDANARNFAYAGKVAVERQASATLARQAVGGAVPVIRDGLVQPAMFAAKAKADTGFGTEAYGYRKDNDFLAVKENPLSTFLHRRGHGVLRERPSLHQRRPASAGRRRAHRGAGQLFPLPLSGAGRQRAVLSESRGRVGAVGAGAPPGAHRPQGPRGQRRHASGGQLGVPARCVGLDAVAQQAAAGETVAPPAGGQAAARRPRGDRGLCGGVGPGAGRRLR